MRSVELEVRTGSARGFTDLTPACARFAADAAQGGDGLLHVFVPHATAGVVVIELNAGSEDDALKALQVGQIDGAIIDYPVVKYAEREKKDLAVVETIPTGEQYGIWFKKGNDKLRAAVNEQIDSMKKNGTYAEIYRKWFGECPSQTLGR